VGEGLQKPSKKDEEVKSLRGGTFGIQVGNIRKEPGEPVREGIIKEKRTQEATFPPSGGTRIGGATGHKRVLPADAVFGHTFRKLTAVGIRAGRLRGKRTAN